MCSWGYTSRSEVGFCFGIYLVGVCSKFCVEDITAAAAAATGSSRFCGHFCGEVGIQGSVLPESHNQSKNSINIGLRSTRSMNPSLGFRRMQTFLNPKRAKTLDSVCPGGQGTNIDAIFRNSLTLTFDATVSRAEAATVVKRQG